MKTTLAQLNPTVGALEENASQIKAVYDKAHKEGSDLVITPELSLVGYPPEDLVLRPHFQQQAKETLKALAQHTKGKNTAVLVGSILRTGNYLFNAAFLLEDGEVSQTICKYNLPNYGVFDEKRVFSKGPIPRPIPFKDGKLGILICEDMWEPNLASALKKQGADMLIAMNASPYEKYKDELRYKLARRCVRATNLPLIYVNQVGGQDEIVFDGYSFIINPNDTLADHLLPWQETHKTVTWKAKKDGWHCASSQKKATNELPEQPILDMTYTALKTGLHDYVNKNNFPGIILGLSGGIDSALSAAIAVDAIGAERVHAVMMPSEFTSDTSKKDARENAKLLGITLDETPITPTFEALKESLENSINTTEGLTQENLQSRIRGNILMAISNATGNMVLTTGNKSEMAVGYATLYGDMCGGYSVLKDIYKTDVYKLAHYRNDINEVIPKNILTKAPTAELRPDQKDSDSLPPYDILDDILEQLIEYKRSRQEVINAGHGEHTVNNIANLLYKAEYKRRQSPPGVKVTAVAFGKDRRYPITSGFKG